VNTMWTLFKLVVEIPALDRFMDYIEATQQKDVDALTALLEGSTAGLKASIEKEQS
jgi:hypothetical protein